MKTKYEFKYPEMDYLTNEELCDVVFVVNGQRIPALKQFLSVKSRVFRVMFKTYNKLNECVKTVVPIEDTTYKAFKSFINYLYCDELVMTYTYSYNDLQLIEDIGRLSAAYKVFSLLDKIIDNLKPRVDYVNKRPWRFRINFFKSDHKLIEVFEIINRLKKSYDVIKYPEMHYFMNEVLSDVVFIVNGRRVPALKQLLIIKSRVFRAMFTQNFKESVEKEVVIKETTFKAFKILIHFLYFNELLLKVTNDSEIYEVFKLLDRYEVLRLNTEVCDQFIITFENFKDLTEIAFYFEIENLKTNIMSFINKNIDYLFRNNFEYIQDFNDRTNNKLLDVLTSNEEDSNSDLEYFDVHSPSVISVSKEIIKSEFKNSRLKPLPFKEAFKSFIGYIYFRKLNYMPNEDIELTHQVFELAKRNKNYDLMSKITAVLHISITVENCEQILKFASDYDIKNLLTKVLEFIERNINRFDFCFYFHQRFYNRLTDETIYRLLKVLTNKTLNSGRDIINCEVNGIVIPIIRRFVWNERSLNALTSSGEWIGEEVVVIEDTTFEAFHTIIGFLYFRRLVLKDKTRVDFKHIREVCKLAKRYNLTKLIGDIGVLLRPQINFDNFEHIWRIAFDFNSKYLVTSIIIFLRNNIYKNQDEVKQLLYSRNFD